MANVPSTMGRLMKCSGGRGRVGGKRQGCVFFQRGCRPNSCLRQSHKQLLFYCNSKINIIRPKKCLGLRIECLDEATVQVLSWPEGCRSVICLSCFLLRDRAAQLPTSRNPIYALSWLFLCWFQFFLSKSHHTQPLINTL